MTCFSIQKTLCFFLVLAFASVVLTVAPVRAQTDPVAEAAKAAAARAETIGEDGKPIKKKSRSRQKADEAKKKAVEEMRVDAPIIIELFTASDCSACIFADRMLYDAMKDKNVIALSCHIKDLSDMRSDDQMVGDKTPNFETSGPIDPCVFRQWAYRVGRKSQDVTINIPTFYFNGQKVVNGADMTRFNAMLSNYHFSGFNRVIEAMMRWKDKDTISIHLPASKNENDRENASVWLIRYKNMEVEKMEQGVNMGRVLRFSNIVQNITHVGKWRGDVRTIDVDVNPPQGGKERGGYTVIVSKMLGDDHLVGGQLDDYPVAADMKEEAERRARAKAANVGKLQAIPSTKEPTKSGPVVP